VKRASARDLFELAFQFCHPVADQPAVGLDLGLAGTAEEAEAAALALEVGPGPDQASRLIVEVGEFDLEAALRGRRPLAENLEDQAGAVDHLGLGAVLQIFLLDRRDSAVDDEQFRFGLTQRVGNPVDLPGPEQGRRPRLADAEMESILDRDADRFGQAGRLVQPRVDIAAIRLAEVGQRDDRAGAAGKFILRLTIENAQPFGSSPCASARLIGCSGCTVEMACL